MDEMDNDMEPIKILYSNHMRFIFPRNLSTLSIHDLNIVKSNKGKGVKNALHRVRREDRFMYGPLTKKGKQTLEKSTNILQSNSTLMDTELWWHLKHSKCMMKPFITTKPLTVMKVKNLKMYKKVDPSDQSRKCDVVKVTVNTKKDIKINSVMSKNVNEVETTCHKQDTENNREVAIKTIDNTDKLKIPALKKAELRDVVINNMTMFSILNPKKTLPPTAGKMDIISISAKDEPTTLHYPSVTKILAATLSAQSRRVLELWKAKLIAEMGEDKFNEYYQELLKSGSMFHSCIENTLYGKSVYIPDNVRLAFDSLSNVMKEVKDIRAIESLVSHEHLQYKGKMDCVAVYRGELCVIDWKKSDKEKNSLSLTYDAPMQIAAYIGALNYSKKYPFTVNTGLIVVGYTNGKPADAYIVKDNILKLYWKKWLMKLQKYWSSVSTKS